MRRALSWVVVLAVGGTIGAVAPRMGGSATSAPPPATSAPVIREPDVSEPAEIAAVVEPGAPATAAARRAMAHLDRIERTLRSTAYRHRTRVDERAGLYQFDCSGMVNYVVRPAAPRAFAALRRPRPVARTYARVIAAAPTDRARRGWQRVARVEDARPGDVFAFERQAWWPGNDTGHVGFFVSAPRPVLGRSRLFLATIADSSGMPLLLGPRSLGGAGGHGRHDVAFQVDADGAVVALGWLGLVGPTIPIEVQIGRLVR